MSIQRDREWEIRHRFGIDIVQNLCFFFCFFLFFLRNSGPQSNSSLRHRSLSPRPSCLVTNCPGPLLSYMVLLGSSRGEGNGTPLQYSCLQNPMERGAWWMAVHGVLRVGHDWATHSHFSLSCIWEGNGNPLQCSCLENPRDGGAWWAAVHGVA